MKTQFPLYGGNSGKASVRIVQQARGRRISDSLLRSVNMREL